MGMKITMRNVNMMEVTVVIIPWMDGTITAMRVNVKILMPELQNVSMNCQLKNAKMPNVTEHGGAENARIHVDFADASIFCQLPNVTKRNKRENVTDLLLLKYARRLAIFAKKT